ncbi:MAG TPA: cytochrome D1 domain-containing protein [Blastocatellia bacterium]|nr:cytochrome D1 domain-containing protein [Blastocatellia bacterium]
MVRACAAALFMVVAAISLVSAPARFSLALEGAAQDYVVYVVCESADKIARVRFGPKGARVDKIIDTGIMVPDIDGPHGIAISPDKSSYYVSLGHGRPFGSVLKYSAGTDTVVGRVTLGMFPATLDVGRDGNFLFVVNFNLHGDPVPSSVSIVATEVMLEVARVQTCVMPHGSRINPSGSKQYSVCMMDDALVEIDTTSFQVSRHYILTKGKERAGTGPPRVTPGGHAGHQMDHGSEPPKPGDASCSPTWAQPSKDGSSVYVACNKSDEIVEIDVDSWKVKQRLKSRPGVYNLAVTSDNRLVATNKRDQSVSVIDPKTGNELARLATRRKVVHGVVVSPDDRYAFVTVEGVGAEPGTVEIIDLSQLKIVATVDLPEQAAGIDFFRTEPVK